MKLRINQNYQTIILFLLWISGMLKIFIQTYVIESFDIVLVALILATLDMVFRLLTNFKVPSQLYVFASLVILSLFLYLTFSLSFTPSDKYGLLKTINFVPNMVFFFYAGFIRKIDFRLFVKCYAYVVIPTAIFFIYMKSLVWWIVDSEATQTFMELRNHYLSVGVHLGILFFLLLQHFKKVWLILLTVFLLFASSARGALLFTILTYLFFKFSSIVKVSLKKKTIASIFTLAILASLVGLYKRDFIYRLSANALNRFLVLFEGQGISTRNRIDGMQYAFLESFSSTSNFLFGHGIGSFGINYSGIDKRLYPHNILLEIQYELGLIGTFLFVVLVVLCGFSFMRGYKTISILLFFIFLNTMKSSNLTDLWILFSLFGLALNQRKIQING